MTSSLSIEKFGSVLLLRIKAPPVNALGARLRSDMQKALAAAVEDYEVTALVVSGQGKMFSAGADIAESNAPGCPRSRRSTARHWVAG